MSRPERDALEALHNELRQQLGEELTDEERASADSLRIIDSPQVVGFLAVTKPCATVEEWVNKHGGERLRPLVEGDTELRAVSGPTEKCDGDAVPEGFERTDDGRLYPKPKSIEESLADLRKPKPGRVHGLVSGPARTTFDIPRPRSGRISR